MFCEQCGNQLSEGAKFCNKCGQNVGLLTPQFFPSKTHSQLNQSDKTASNINKSIKEICGIFVIAVFLGSIYLVWNSQKSIQTQNPLVKLKEERIAGDNAILDMNPIVVTANGLLIAYKENQITADKMYYDKTLEVTGDIFDFGRDVLSGDARVQLEGSSGDGLTCTFSKKHEGELASLSKGKEITVRGICAGSIMGLGVEMHSCVVIK